MTEKKKLTTEDFSNVWKDNNNTLASGLKLDLIQHLLQQRLSEEWVDAKQRVIKIMKLDQFDKSKEIKILDIGCGLGIDLMLVAEEATRLDKIVTIIGLDQNSTMIDEAKKLCDNQKDHLSSNVSIQIMHGDILQMEFEDETFDIVRSDITLQHVDLTKALTEIKRVLKVNGRLIALEGGAGNIYSSDETMIEKYDTVLPNRRDGGTGIRLQFMLPKMNFDIRSSNPTAFLQSGQFLASQDKNWIKMKGMGEMLVTKGVLTEEESKEFQKRYIEACETNQVVAASILFIIEAVKRK
jgi:ubiquinone/menaquinone biosynthesis C-methylase UbiE